MIIVCPVCGEDGGMLWISQRAFTHKRNWKTGLQGGCGTEAHIGGRG